MIVFITDFFIFLLHRFTINQFIIYNTKYWLIVYSEILFKPIRPHIKYFMRIQFFLCILTKIMCNEQLFFF